MSELILAGAAFIAPFVFQAAIVVFVAFLLALLVYSMWEQAGSPSGVVKDKDGNKFYLSDIEASPNVHFDPELGRNVYTA